MKVDDLKRRVDELIQLAANALLTATPLEHGGLWVDHEIFYQFRTASLSFFQKTFGEDNHYFKDFNSIVTDFMAANVEIGRGILSAAKGEIEGGWLFEIKGIVSAEIFSDFLEMACHLLEEEYKDAAAVMIGSILEEHLRQLCYKNAIPVEVIDNGKSIPKKADLLNSELGKANSYNKLDQKQVTAWLDLRNKAAHGNYGEYSKEQVVLMYQGVTNFMERIK